MAFGALIRRIRFTLVDLKVYCATVVACRRCVAGSTCGDGDLGAHWVGSIQGQDIVASRAAKLDVGEKFMSEDSR